jgi:molybdate transport system ATP-binding protein
VDPHLISDAERRFRGGTTVEARFEIPRPGFSVTVLFGPSGSGKTTALRLLAGLERADRGTIRFGGTAWSDADRGVHQPPQARDLGFLPQAYHLFPHLSVAANLGYGLASLNAHERNARVGELLTLLDLKGLEARHPGLSVDVPQPLMSHDRRQARRA